MEFPYILWQVTTHCYTILCNEYLPDTYDISRVLDIEEFLDKS